MMMMMVIEKREEAVFKLCAKYPLVSYCDKDCQKEHWKKVHRHHCNFLSRKESQEGYKH